MSRPQQHCKHRLRTAPTSAPPLELSFIDQQERRDDNWIDGTQSLQLAAQQNRQQRNNELANSDANSPCSICRKMNRYRLKLMAGLFLPVSIQALDATIIAGALPFIASDFNELSQLSWIVSAFNLTSATFIPAWGQFADIFGRYAALQSALMIMLIGSALCAGAPVTAFAMLLVGRALQGIGCAGLLIVTKVIFADKVSLRENARNNTLYAILAGVGYGVGPIAGGYLTQVSWRWCFILNVPICVASLMLVHFVLRSELVGPQRISRLDDVPEAHEVLSNFMTRVSTIDFGGQVMFLFGMGLLILALTWGGSSYPWSDVQVIAPLAIGCFLIGAFLLWEYLMLPENTLATRYPYRKPMIPLKLLITRNAGLLIYINFVTGMALYAVFYFVDLYFVLVLDNTPGEAGKNLIYYTPGLGAGVLLAVIACNKYPRKTWPPLALGTLIEPLGITLLAVALRGGNLNAIYGMLALTGVGTGIRLMPGTLHGVAYFPTHIASIVSLMALAVALGGAFATTIMINVFNNSISKASVSFSPTSISSFNAISSLSIEEQETFKDSSKSSIALSFFAISSFLWLGLLAVSELGNVNIAENKIEIQDSGEHESSNIVEKGSYIRSLVRRK